MNFEEIRQLFETAKLLIQSYRLRQDDWYDLIASKTNEDDEEKALLQVGYDYLKGIMNQLNIPNMNFMFKDYTDLCLAINDQQKLKYKHDRV